MPILPVPSLPPRPIVRLELTPTWWPRLAKLLSDRPEVSYVEARGLLARCTAYALGLHPTRILTSKRSFEVEVATLGMANEVVLLCERAARVIEKLEWLDPSCLDRAEAEGL
jgi:hypothetical protein